MKVSKHVLMFSVPFFLVSLAPSRASAADDAPNPIESLANCRKIADNAVRVACYDRTVDGLTVAVNRNDIAIVNKEQVKESRKKLFGFNVGKLPIFGDAEDDSASNVLTTTITSVRALPYDETLRLAQK
jgi:hypothetical protein